MIVNHLLEQKEILRSINKGYDGWWPGRKRTVIFQLYAFEFVCGEKVEGQWGMVHM